MRRTPITETTTSDASRSGVTTSRRFRRFGRDAYRKQYSSRPADDVVAELTIIADRFAS